MGTWGLESNNVGDGVLEILSCSALDSQFHLWSGGDRLQPCEDQIESKC